MNIAIILGRIPRYCSRDQYLAAPICSTRHSTKFSTSTAVPGYSCTSSTSTGMAYCGTIYSTSYFMLLVVLVPDTNYYRYVIVQLYPSTIGYYRREVRPY